MDNLQRQLLDIFAGATVLSECERQYIKNLIDFTSKINELVDVANANKIPLDGILRNKATVMLNTAIDALKHMEQFYHTRSEFIKELPSEATTD